MFNLYRHTWNVFANNINEQNVNNEIINYFNEK